MQTRSADLVCTPKILTSFQCCPKNAGRGAAGPPKDPPPKANIYEEIAESPERSYSTPSRLRRFLQDTAQYRVPYEPQFRQHNVSVPTFEPRSSTPIPSAPNLPPYANDALPEAAPKPRFGPLPSRTRMERPLPPMPAATNERFYPDLESSYLYGEGFSTARSLRTPSTSSRRSSVS